ncbi:MAG: 2Fe-2S iron-sulfur cluster binding domain-containing protein [Proteobacteria bacterium]|nr:2Fe-2S iron-sulfur cluster binding domain-containing protein [Pseudomonadota bacterium]
MIEILVGLAAMSGLTAVLAALLEAADFWFLDYGEVVVSINEGEKEITAKGGGKLLDLLADNGIFIPSACGGRGSCGLCKVRVLSGGGMVLPTETPYLSPEEAKDNTRLSCQVKARNDLAIRIPSEYFNIKRFKARVESLANLTETNREVRMKLLDPTEMNFKPGQYVQLLVPPYKGSPESVSRAYSIASGPEDKSSVSLVITRVPQGLATTWVHDILAEGDEIELSGPYGKFHLRDTDAEMIMVATGSGLAPILSILLQMALAKSHRKATLYFGTKTTGDLFYTDQLKELEGRLPGFRFVPVLSNVPEGETWDGETGMVTDPIKRKLEKEGGEGKEAYLCGNPFMINAAVKMFMEYGISEDKIFYDKFG